MSNFDHQRFPRRLNLGCGFDHREAYLNVDLNECHTPDLVADVCELTMLPSGYYEEIIAQDVLEHLPRTSTSKALREWNRLLQVGGRLYLRVPSLEALASLFQQSNSFERHAELMHFLFGTQAYTGDFHLTSFTQLLLEGYLRQAGFQPETITILHDWLFDASAKKISALIPDSLEQGKKKLFEISEPRDFVAAAYRLLLRREPDSEGQAFFLDGLRAGHLEYAQVVAIIEGSPEYHQLQSAPSVLNSIENSAADSQSH